MENIFLIDKFKELTSTSEGILSLSIAFVLAICFLTIFTSILTSFSDRYSTKKSVVREKKSVVDTLTMFMFYIGYYFLLRFNVLRISISSDWLNISLIVIGLTLVIIGTYVNVRGRFALGGYWANQIEIYKDHKLMTSGLFAVVRHPLYASLIWIFYGASLAYGNLAGILANTLIFIPFMYMRAKQEEALLIKTFPDYKDYMKRVGMFVPRIV